jgi:hypothetical protein
LFLDIRLLEPDFKLIKTHTVKSLRTIIRRAGNTNLQLRNKREKQCLGNKENDYSKKLLEIK